VDGRSVLLIFAGLVAGLISALGGCFFYLTLWILPGVMFGVLVAGPWTRMCDRASQVWCNVGLSVGGYVVAHVIAVTTDFLAAPFGAAIGTAIVLSVSFVDPEAVIRRAAWRALVVGTVGGCIFTAFSFVPGGWWGMLLGIVVWQIAVAAALGTTFRSEKATPDNLRLMD
jgi:hypothetical protein